MIRIRSRLAPALGAALLTAGVAGAQARPWSPVDVHHTATGDTLRLRGEAGAAPLVVWLPRGDSASAYLVQGTRRAPFPPDWARRFRKWVLIDSLERDLAAKGHSP